MKVVRKLIPVSLYDLPGLEGWLEEMANEELHPIRLGSWATFQKGGKPGTRFRLDAFGRHGLGPELERLELYREMGWQYALSVGRAFFLFYSTDPAAPELHTDHTTRGQSLDRLARQMKWVNRRWYFILGLFLLLALLFCFLPPSRFDVQPDRFAALPLILLRLTGPFLLCLACILFFIIPAERRDTRLMRRLHDNLRDGLPPPPSPGPSRRILRENQAILAWLPILLFALLGYHLWKRPVPLEQFSRPYIALAELESEPVESWEELFGSSFFSFHKDENLAEQEFSILAPVWYTTTENGYSPQEGWMGNGLSPDPEGGRYRYSPDLDMAYVQLTIPAMARPVAESLLDELRLVNLLWSYEDVKRPGTDFIILACEPDGLWQMAAVARDGRVAAFRYAGQERLANHLDTLASMVTP